MAVQGALCFEKRLSLNHNFSFVNWISLSYQVTTQLSSRDWVDPIPDPILPGYSRELNPGPIGWSPHVPDPTLPGYSRESNPGPLGRQSDVLTSIPNRRSAYEDPLSSHSLVSAILSLFVTIHMLNKKTR